MRHDGVFLYNDNAIAHHIAIAILVFLVALGADNAVVADARVLIDDGIFDARMAADSNGGNVLGVMFPDGIVGLVKIRAHHHHPMKLGSGSHNTAHANNTVTDLRAIDDAAITKNGVVNSRAVNFTGGQKARAREDGRGHIEEIKLGQLAGRIKISIEKRFNRADILPITLIYIGK